MASGWLDTTGRGRGGAWKLLVSTGLGGNWRTGRSLTIGAM